MVQELQSNFIEEIKEGVTFVDFYADWCTPCRMMMPVVEALSEEYASKVKFLKVNVDENQEIAQNIKVLMPKKGYNPLQNPNFEENNQSKENEIEEEDNGYKCD